MDPDPGLIAIGVGICLCILAFTSAVDTAFTAISRHRLNALLEEGVPRAQLLSRLMTDPYRIKAVIILLNTSVTIIATSLTLHLVRNVAPWIQVIALILLLFIMLVGSEVLPKALASRAPDTTALILSSPFNLTMHLLEPIVMVITLLTRPLIHLIQGPNTPSMPLVTEEELRLMVNVGEEEGLIEHDEREMIEGIFSFGDTLVREIMVPRVDIIALEVNTPLEKALDFVISEGHSRIPVYEETIDTIVGILYAKDLLPVLRDGQRHMSLADLSRSSIHFVPETMKVDMLLKQMQQRKIHMAIIVDEYGGTAGLATIEDLLEEIVGEIQDEYDIDEEPSIQVITETELIVDARVSIDDINDLTGLSLQSTDADRIGGLVYEQLGRVPLVGDKVVLDEATVTVLSMQGVRPEKLRITFKYPAERDGGMRQTTEDSPTLMTHDNNDDLLAALLTQRQPEELNGKEDTWNNMTIQS